MKATRRIFLFPALFLLFACAGLAQQFAGRAMPKYAHPALDAQFAQYEVYRLDPAALSDFLSDEEGEVTLRLELGAHQWLLRMAPSEIIDPEYRLRVAQPGGSVVTLPSQATHIAWSGEVLAPDGLEAALTVTPEVIYGYAAFADEDWFIEPVWYFVPSAPRDLVVVYAATDVRPGGGTCAAIELAGYERPAVPQPPPDKNTGNGPEAVVTNCYEVELAIASDWLMYQKYGSVAAVESHNVGVMNNVATNWDNEFAHEIQFVIVEQFVSSCSSCDPWTSSTDAGDLLSSFTSWGPTGFTATHDLGQLWTDRDFDGSTVGIAWLGVVCTSYRYHCLQDFSSNADFLRVLTSHEIGHNFNASHNNPSCGCIMDPAVNNTNTWSAQSVNTINTYISNLLSQGNCLSACSSTQVPPVADFTASPTSGCAPLTVQYTDLSSNNPTSWQWSFPGGSPSSSTQQNPVVTYSTPGSYDATLVASNAAGSSTETKTGFITVEGAPLASFTYVVSGLTATFTNTTTGNALSYLWDFGDGNISTQSDPVHTYAQDGFYQVSLTATNACGSTVFVQTLTVFVPPQADFSASPTTGCAPLTVQFTDESTPNVLNWSWTFEGGVPGSSTAQNPAVQYQAPGTYGVTLTVSNPAGTDTWSVSDYITVNIEPVAAFLFAVNADTVAFVNQSVGADSYLWNFGDGTTSTDANPVHVYAEDGTYTVTLTATNECGSTTTSQTVTILTPPQADFSASPTSGCAPLTVQFTDQSSSNVLAWEWHFEGGAPAISADQNPVVVYDTPGTWDVTLIVHNGAGSDTMAMPDLITVNEGPTAAFVAVVNFDTVAFVNASQNATSYLWNFGDGSTSTDANPTHIYAEDGTYTVILTATNACGSHTAAQQLTISTQPQAGLSANATSGCAPFTVQFTDQSSANVTSWQWTFEGGNPSSSTDQNPVVTYQSAGVYGVTLTVSNAAGSDTVAYPGYIAVGDVPSAAFGASQHLDTVWLSNNSTDATSYWWDFGDGTTSTASDPMHVYASDGTYAIVLVATNDCGTDTAQQQVTIVTPPQAGLSANATSGCAPFTVQFTDQSSANATSWQWTFEGGSPSSSTDQNPVVTYQSAGVYGVTLTVSNAAGSDTVSYPGYIEVGDVPSAAITSVSINGATVSLGSNTVGADSILWDFGDGTTSTEASPQHTYTADDAYTVVLTATNACGTATADTLVVIATEAPVAAFTSDQQEGCPGMVVQFENLSSANAAWFEWSFPGGTPAASTEPEPVVTYTQPGMFDVTLIAGNALGADTFTLAGWIVVQAPPAAAFSYAVNDTTAAVAFTDESAGAASWFWDFGDGTTSTEPSPVHAYGQVGTFSVMLVVGNDCGTDTLLQDVVITGVQPTAMFSADVTSGCAPLTIQFTDLSTGNVTGWQWTFPGGTPATSTQQHPLVTYTQPGAYDVTLEVTNIAGSHMLVQTQYIVVEGPPQADFTWAADSLSVQFDNNTSGATSYWWDFGDGATAMEANPVHVYAEAGTYEVTLVAANDCGSDTISQTVQLTLTGLTAPPFARDLRIFPNPNDGWFTIEVAGNRRLQLELVDAWGRTVYRDEMDGGASPRRQIDGRHLPKGIYLLRLTDGQAVWYEKIAIQ